MHTIFHDIWCISYIITHGTWTAPINKMFAFCSLSPISWSIPHISICSMQDRGCSTRWKIDFFYMDIKSKQCVVFSSNAHLRIYNKSLCMQTMHAFAYIRFASNHSTYNSQLIDRNNNKFAQFQYCVYTNSIIINTSQQHDLQQSLLAKHKHHRLIHTVYRIRSVGNKTYMNYITEW